VPTAFFGVNAGGVYTVGGGAFFAAVDPRKERNIAPADDTSTSPNFYRTRDATIVPARIVNNNDDDGYQEGNNGGGRGKDTRGEKQGSADPDRWGEERDQIALLTF